jgi:tol-pal system protein YbgF
VSSPVRFLVPLTALVWAGCAVLPPQGPARAAPAPSPRAAKPAPDASASKLDYFQTRLTRLEQIVDRFSTTLKDVEKNQRELRADQSVYVEELRSELKTLKGLLEAQQYEVQQTNQQQQRHREDFDARLQELEKAAARRSSETGGRPVGANEIARYDQILRLIRDQKNYGAAVREFDQFLKDFPDSSLAANAQYWKAEGHFALGDYAMAVAEFQKVVEKYPQSDKVCDARLKQGYCFLERGEKDKARAFLTEVTQHCAATPSADKAAEKLADLNRR